MRLLCFLFASLAIYAAPDFERDIKSIFASSCAGCHEGAKPAANLRLDSLQALQKGGANGPAILPGNAAGSLLLARVSSTDKATRMPPAGKMLDSAQLQLLTEWINGLTPALSVDFAKDVKPIFAEKCYSCHSGSRPRSELRLDARKTALQGGAGGVVIVPGDSAKSRLMDRVLGLHGERRMPLGGSPLNEKELDILRSWIDQGAKWPDAEAGDPTLAKHWSYVKPQRPAVPAMQSSWVRNPIDAFLLARMTKEGLKPSSEASKVALIRRLSFDLTGLPPTLAEVDAFVKDESPQAYEKLVDRLLASPHYGERWARLWLDLARYADTNGFEKDLRRSMWKYRDWVISALNRNMPFDQFSIEQLAGDMLPNATLEQRIATGFNRNTMFNEEGGVDAAEAHWEVLIDRVNTTSTVWLGSTLACAQCHNHKFDAFSQKEFYQFLAFFNNAKYDATPYADTSIKWTETRVELPDSEQRGKLDVLRAEITKIDTKLKTQTPALDAEQAAWEQQLVQAPTLWSTLGPSKLKALGGSTLTPQQDGSILASGDNPESEAYFVETKSALPRITALRLEALPHATLPRGGPGRDVYGNGTLTEFDVEIAPASNPSQWTKLEGVTYKTDNGGIGKRTKDEKSLWFVDATRETERLPRQLLLIPDKPFGFPGGTLIRVTLGFYSELYQQSFGRFRLSATGMTAPEKTVQIAHRLRPLLATPVSKRSEEDRKRISEAFRAVAPSLQPERKKLDDLRKQVNALGVPTALVMEDADPYERPSADLRIRGSFLSKGERVYAATPAALHGFPETSLPNRLGLARWLVSKDNPLTARVMMNRIWETYFGIGIVETSEDFGTQGSKPWHPELLDWLAVEFMESGWDMKHMHQLIVMSSAYRQASTVTPELQEKDPYNRFLARGSRFRLEAELVRDNALAISGLLSSKVGGPSVFPYQPEGIWDVPYSSDRWMESKGEDRYRRGLYTFIRRSSPYPSMTAFDAPSREQCTVRRPRTNTPLQALNTLNDPVFFEAAQALAKRVLKEAPASEEARVQYAFRLATQRDAKPAESAALLAWLNQEKSNFTSKPEAAKKIADNAESAAWTMLANVLLNLDETLTRE